MHHKRHCCQTYCFPYYDVNFNNDKKASPSLKKQSKLTKGQQHKLAVKPSVKHNKGRLPNFITAEIMVAYVRRKRGCSLYRCPAERHDVLGQQRMVLNIWHYEYKSYRQ